MEINSFNLNYLRVERYKNKDMVFDDYSRLPRPFSSIAYIINGSWSFTQTFSLTHESIVGEISEGNVMYIPKGATYTALWHKSPESNKNYASCLSVHFDITGSIFDSQKTRIQCLDGFKTTPLPIFEELYTTDTKAREKKHNDITDIGNQFSLAAMLMTLLAQGIPSIKLYNNIDMRLKPALTYLQEHITEKISVSQLASACFLSEPNFFLLFKRSMGMSYTKYRNSLLISLSEQLLNDHLELSIEEISDKLGFSSSTYFRKVFKDHTGYSPRYYRNLNNHL